MGEGMAAATDCGGVKCLDVRLGNPKDVAAGKQTPQQVAAQLLSTVPALRVSAASAGGVTSHQWRRLPCGNALLPPQCCPAPAGRPRRCEPETRFTATPLECAFLRVGGGGGVTLFLPSGRWICIGLRPEALSACRA